MAVDAAYWNDLWDLFVAFLRASNLGFGGGQSIIPLVQVEVVNNYGWMSNTQFNEVVAVTNALPGPIATKLAAYAGYQVASWPGVAVATAATIMPTILILVMAGKIIAKYSQNPGMKSMLKGVRPIVTVLIGVVAVQWMIDIGMEGIEHNDAWLIGGSVLIGIGAAVGFYFKIHPAILIVAAMGLGYLIF
jgi:chromate transporter